MTEPSACEHIECGFCNKPMECGLMSNPPMCIRCLEHRHDKLYLADLEQSVELARLRERVRELEGLINAPEILDFEKAVKLEAAHQRERWGSDHDAGKTDADWFWLIGYLAGKSLHNPGGEQEKKLHRIVTVAAAACNWHAATLGKTNMRPGIDPARAALAPEGKEGVE